ncbi:hypothetical protein K3495_g9002 [Podosphaera aphanis]|nr:hypothetical protein K3495_g9002 [Podosphaera aphanis]
MDSPVGFENMNRPDYVDYDTCEPERGKMPLPKGLGILQHWIDKKSTRANGEPPKRRGPKRDSKPALTRRQELNRQAQRTHRERKELYIKALEQQVQRLKVDFTALSRERDAIAEENRQIKALLSRFKIPWATAATAATTAAEVLGEPSGIMSTGNLSSGVYSRDQALGSQAYSPHTSFSNSRMQDTVPSGSSLSNTGPAPASYHHHQGMDYNQAGIDFVLTLERPCLEHMHNLIEQASIPGGRPCGHALMASCPPDPVLATHLERPSGNHQVYLDQATQRTWDISKSELGNLFNLSKRLNLGGEITPVMAWGMIQAHPRFHEMNLVDFDDIANELLPKVKCYGFGAVLEGFEIRDAISRVFYDKPGTMQQ